jgi:[acyl-carrier-protein] S-malonyltransferase
MDTVTHGLLQTDAVVREGIEPSVVTSHSLGIYAALHAAGSLSAEDALVVAWRAGELLQETSRRRPGGLLAITGLDLERVEGIVTRVGGTLGVACRNGGAQFVLGGSWEDIARAEAEAGDALTLDRIEAGGALHTPMVDAMIPDLLAFVGDLEIRPPRRPYLSHRRVRYLETAEEVREALGRQVRDPILWSDCLVRLDRDGAWLFVDMGPGSVLQRSIRWVLRRARVLALDGGDSPEAVVKAMEKGR